jgi:hypothetical protein
MAAEPMISLQAELARPGRGGSTRVQVGSSEIVLEATRGGYSLLWLDGRQSRRFAVGLPAQGELSLRFAAPRLPVRVVVRDTLMLAPRGRLHGYLQVPLVPTICWCGASGGAQRLVEFPREELAAEWDDRDGTVYRCVSPFHVRYPVPGATPRATVPVWLANPTQAVASPAFVPLQLEDAELRLLRNGVAVRPRRLVWNGQILQPLVRRQTEVSL